MNELVERLAELEHEQWAHWTRYMIDNMTADSMARWRKQTMTPYVELSEAEKESDREWARKVLKAHAEWLREPKPADAEVWRCPTCDTIIDRQVMANAAHQQEE